MGEVIKPPDAAPVRQPAPARSLGEIMRGILRDPTVPADKLEMLWRMSKEMLAEERREAFDAAFAEMSGELPQVQRDGRIELRKDGKLLGLVPFAKWESMDKVIRPILAKHGFSLRFNNIYEDNALVVVAYLSREGHTVEGRSPRLPADTGPGRNAVQASGSASSYGKRYAAEAVLNIVRCGQDDDGSRAAAPVTAEQAKQLADLVKELGETEARFIKWANTGATTYAELPAREFPRLLNALNDRKRTKAAAAKPARGAK